MIAKEDFHALRKEVKAAEEQREAMIQLSREIIRESKLIIYSIHRGQKPELKKIQSLTKRLRKSGTTGIEETAFQEYVEAVCFYHYIFHKQLPTRKELDVDAVAYLSGLSDLSGELVRKAVKDIIGKKYESVKEITGFVEELYGEFLTFDFRGDLRKKADAVRWNLQKLEELLLGLERR